MDTRALSLAVIAMLCGVALLHLYMRSFEARVSGGKKQPVLVVTRDAAAGETLSRSMLGVRELPEAYVESRHIEARKLEQVVSATLQLPTRANEALLWSDIAGAVPQLHSLSSLVRQGMRALTLRAPDASFGELLHPGDRVDVLLVSQPNGERAAGRARTVVENLLVLAVDGRTERAGAPEASPAGVAGASRVTLALSNEQGQELAYAERVGSLRFLLRNPHDSTLLSSKPAGATRDGAVLGDTRVSP